MDGLCLVFVSVRWRRQRWMAAWSKREMDCDGSKLSSMVKVSGWLRAPLPLWSMGMGGCETTRLARLDGCGDIYSCVVLIQWWIIAAVWCFCHKCMSKIDDGRWADDSVYVVGVVLMAGSSVMCDAVMWGWLFFFVCEQYLFFFNNHHLDIR